METFDAVVFHNPDWCGGPAVSPMVSSRWTRPIVELLLESTAPFSTNDVDLACARFIGWCYANLASDRLLLGVQNVPELPDPEAVENQGDWDARLAAWYQRVTCQLGGVDHVVLVNLATLEITQSGIVLWRPKPNPIIKSSTGNGPHESKEAPP